MHSRDFCQSLATAGYDTYTGVPCSFLTGLINTAMQAYTYINATNEGDAVAIAAGLVLGGKQPVVLMQNSGLGNAVSPITSLLMPFKLPVLLIIGWRGQPGYPDEPQHQLMGDITVGLLQLMGVTPYIFGETDWDIQLAQIQKCRASKTSAAILIPQNALAYDTPAAPVVSGLTRTEALRHIRDTVSDQAVILATTGKTGRELFTLGDSDRYFYQVGSMGCVSAIALGIAQAKPNPLVIIDGDGAALMRLGALASVGQYRPKFLHIILNNGVHDSTGGQATVQADFTACAKALNYPAAYTITTISDLIACIRAWERQPVLTLLTVMIVPGSPATLARPDCLPETVATRLQAYLETL